MNAALSRRPCLQLLTCLPLVLVCASLACADEEDISFKKRGNQEKRFVRAVGVAIVKAAHGTARKIDLIKYDNSEPKKGRTDLTIKMEYYGVATNKRYLADIVVKIDSSNKDAWEVLNIDYADNNGAIKPNDRKIQELIRKLNR
jgi:hypothetical protein